MKTATRQKKSRELPLGIGQIRQFHPDRVRPLPGQPRKRFSGIIDRVLSRNAITATQKRLTNGRPSCNY